MFRVELMPAIAETHVCFSESNYRPNKNRGILCPFHGSVKWFLCHKTH